MLTLAEHFKNDLISAENKFDRLIDEMHTLAGRIEYQRGRIDAIREMQKHISELPDGGL
jgi:uncharacterized membrane protein